MLNTYRIKTLAKIVAFLAIIGMFWVGFSEILATSEEQSNKILKESVAKAITACYAIEGIYPPDMDYLEENYGVRVDYNKYYVNYQVFGSNIRPSVQIIKLGDLSGEEGDIFAGTT